MSEQPSLENKAIVIEKPPIEIEIGEIIARPKSNAGYLPLDLERGETDGHKLIRIKAKEDGSLTVDRFRQPGVVGVLRQEVPKDTIAFRVTRIGSRCVFLEPICLFK